MDFSVPLKCSTNRYRILLLCTHKPQIVNLFAKSWMFSTAGTIFELTWTQKWFPTVGTSLRSFGFLIFQTFFRSNLCYVSNSVIWFHHFFYACIINIVDFLGGPLIGDHMVILYNCVMIHMGMTVTLTPFSHFCAKILIQSTWFIGWLCDPCSVTRFKPCCPSPLHPCTWINVLTHPCNHMSMSMPMPKSPMTCHHAPMKRLKIFFI